MAVHPLLFVYVIVEVPADTPVTIPKFEIDATDVLDEIHAFELAADALPVNVIVDPTQTELLPVIVGFELTVTVAET